MTLISNQEVIGKEQYRRPISMVWTKGKHRLKYHRLRRKGRIAEAHQIMVGYYCSAVEENPLLAPYHLYKACYHSLRVLDHDKQEGRTYFDRSPAELSMLAAPMVAMPPVFGRVMGESESLYEVATDLLIAAVSCEHPYYREGREAPCERALNLLMLAHAAVKMGYLAADVEVYVREAIDLKDVIVRKEEPKTARRQLASVMFKAGTFYRDKFPGGRIDGERLIRQAYQLAQSCAPSQVMEIRRYARSRRLRL